ASAKNFAEAAPGTIAPGIYKPDAGRVTLSNKTGTQNGLTSHDGGEGFHEVRRMVPATSVRGVDDSRRTQSLHSAVPTADGQPAAQPGTDPGAAGQPPVRPGEGGGADRRRLRPAGLLRPAGPADLHAGVVLRILLGRPA